MDDAIDCCVVGQWLLVSGIAFVKIKPNVIRITPSLADGSSNLGNRNRRPPALCGKKGLGSL